MKKELEHKPNGQNSFSVINSLEIIDSLTIASSQDGKVWYFLVYPIC